MKVKVFVIKFYG